MATNKVYYINTHSHTGCLVPCDIISQLS